MRTVMICAAILCSIVVVHSYAADAQLAEATALYNAKEYEKAAEILKALRQSSPDDAEVFFESGRVARRQKQLDQAVQWLERATQLQPQNAEFFVALGDAYGALASKNRSFSGAIKARQALEKAVAIAPANERARAALIDFYREAPGIVGGGISRAYAQARELQAIDGPAGTRLLIPLLLSQKRESEALSELKSAVKKYPDDYSLLYLLGRTAATAGNEIEAGVAALERCLQLPVPAGFPDHAHAHVRLGQLYARGGKADLAKRHFEEALRRDEANSDARAGLESLKQLAR